MIVAILAVLLAAAVPAYDTIRSYRQKQLTRDELTTIARAGGEFFRDTLEFPPTVASLVEAPGVAGWAGPYLEPEDGEALAEVELGLDAWSRGVKLASRGDRLDVASAGQDAVFGSDDDVRVELDVGWIRAEITRERLATLNGALERHMAEGGAAASLQPPGSLADDPRALFDVLVAAGLAPASERYRVDAWGAPFELERAADGGLVRWKSANLSRAR